jgi:hypothetical protein
VLGALLAALEPQPDELAGSLDDGVVLVPHVDVASPPLVLLLPHDDVELELLAGALPQPDGSDVAAGVVSGAVVGVAAADVSVAVELDVSDVDEVLDDVAPVDVRFTYAVMSLPAGTMATTSQPSADFCVSFAASEAAS